MNFSKATFDKILEQNLVSSCRWAACAQNKLTATLIANWKKNEPDCSAASASVDWSNRAILQWNLTWFLNQPTVESSGFPIRLIVGGWQIIGLITSSDSQWFTPFCCLKPFHTRFSPTYHLKVTTKVRRRRRCFKIVSRHQKEFDRAKWRKNFIINKSVNNLRVRLLALSFSFAL